RLPNVARRPPNIERRLASIDLRPPTTAAVRRRWPSHGARLLRAPPGPPGRRRRALRLRVRALRLHARAARRILANRAAADHRRVRLDDASVTHIVVRVARHATIAALFTIAAMPGILGGVLFAYAGDL